MPHKLNKNLNYIKTCIKYNINFLIMSKSKYYIEDDCISKAVFQGSKLTQNIQVQGRTEIAHLYSWLSTFMGHFTSYLNIVRLRPCKVHFITIGSGQDDKLRGVPCVDDLQRIWCLSSSRSYLFFNWCSFLVVYCCCCPLCFPDSPWH